MTKPEKGPHLAALDGSDRRPEGPLRPQLGVVGVALGLPLLSEKRDRTRTRTRQQARPHAVKSQPAVHTQHRHTAVEQLAALC